jgi:hypothetical protein
MKRYFLALVTAPGVVFHELGHFIFCWLSGVKVYKVRLFRFGNPAGYVEHEEPHGLVQSILISFGPLSTNSLVSLIAFSRFETPYLQWQNIILLWLGFVVALHSIPSTGDAATLTSIANHKVRRNPLAILAYPFVLIIYILNFLKRYRLHVIYAGLLFFLGSIYLK